MHWPKAPKGFECNFQLKERCSEEYPWDASLLVYFLRPQHASLEQLHAGFRDIEGTTGTLGSSLRDFPKLKRVSLPRTFLVSLDYDPIYCVTDFTGNDEYLNCDMHHLHLAMPLVLEELVLNIDDDVKFLEEGQLPHPDFKALIQEFAMQKPELYPSLKRVVLWTSCDIGEFSAEEIEAQEKKMVYML